MTTDGPSRNQIVIAVVAIFIVAFGVRLLSWHDTRRDVGKVQTVVAADYQHAARLFREEGLPGFFSSTGPLADPNLLGHPPGYPIVIATVWGLFGGSNTSIQLLQILCDSLAAVLIFLIAIELFPFAVGAVSGLLIALAPQFTWNSVLLLPDTLAVFPLVLSVYLLARGWKTSRLIWLILAGACVGISCWLRANALLIAPFLAVAVLFLFERSRRLYFAAAVLAGAILVIAPLTIRNWMVFHHFIPISLGAGQTMLEGISDYDPERRFGIPNTDMGIMKMEAQEHNRPDYYSTLFAPDGIKRDRTRVQRALGIIRDNPGWFLGVMLQRAGSMLRLERARRISPDPPVRQYSALNESQRIWVDTQERRLTSNMRSALVLSTPAVAVKSNHEYVLRLNVVADVGRLEIHINSDRKVVSTAIVEKSEVKDGQPPPLQVVDVPFVSADKAVQLNAYNAAAASESTTIDIRTIELFELGPPSFVWTRPLRWIVRTIQNLFITAVMLPLTLAGLFILIWRRMWRVLLLLLIVPTYYFCFQSLLHTEYRYVLAVHYFLFIVAGVALYEIGNLLFRNLASPLKRDAARAG